MKKICFLLLLLPVLGVAQKIDSTIAKKKIGLLECQYDKHKEQGKETFYTVSISYRNGEYQQLVDYGVVMLMSQGEVDSLSADIEKMMVYIGTKQNVTIEQTEYRLKTVDFSPNLYLYDSEGKWTSMTKAQAIKLQEWLKGIRFPQS